jgi:hypothetical protein
MKLATLILAAAAVSTLAACSAGPATPYGVRLEAIDSHGEAYVIGTGDTCADAWVDHAEPPADLVRLQCVAE